ncbi:hypothetical protein K1T71_005163 [Dendrolimus kikuchii]|uniref:Uncharacterized protein n=1 Tax=Dendrolimus kikuchii TaxID=765133 RepID=A0ACC1D6L2_9NEOP|nr:hypothetical protein K1T71_005163 [Dendrolimus kikuchii]
MGVERKEKCDEEYNPFEHRDVANPTSNIRALANLIKASLGSGLLAMPLAFSNSGWGLGIVGTIIIALVCGHCVWIFVETSRACCKLEEKPLLSYGETCRSAFSNGPKILRPFATTAHKFADFALFFTYVGVCCIFTVLTADSMKQLFDRYVTSTDLPTEYYCLILLLPFCLMCQIRHLKYLAPFSFIANILLFATFAICLYYIFGDKIVMSDKKVVGNIARFPAFLSTVIFAMEGIGAVMPIENTMKKPQHFLGFPGVLVIAMTIILILYSTLGLFGYMRYGEVLRGSITLNLPIDDWPAICAKCFITLSIFLTYPIHFYVLVDIFTKYTEPHIKGKYRNAIQIISRAFFVCFCGGVGIALPLLEQIINIVGSLFYSILGLIIPGIIETVFRWDNLGKFKWILFKNIFVVIFGFLCLGSGCSLAILDMIEILNKKII